MRRTTSRIKATSSAARTQDSSRSCSYDARQQEHAYGGQRQHCGDSKNNDTAYQHGPGPQARRRQQRRHGTSPDDRQIPPVRCAALIAHALGVHPGVRRNPDGQAQRKQPNLHIMTVLRFSRPPGCCQPCEQRRRRRCRFCARGHFLMQAGARPHRAIQGACRVPSGSSSGL